MKKAFKITFLLLAISLFSIKTRATDHWEFYTCTVIWNGQFYTTYSCDAASQYGCNDQVCYCDDYGGNQQ